MKEWMSYQELREVLAFGDDLNAVKWQWHMLEHNSLENQTLDKQGQVMREDWLKDKQFTCELFNEAYTETRYFSMASDAFNWLADFINQDRKVSVLDPESGFIKIQIKDLRTGEILKYLQIKDDVKVTRATLFDKYRVIRKYVGGGHDTLYYTCIELLEKDLDKWMFEKCFSTKELVDQNTFRNRFYEIDIHDMTGHLCCQYICKSGERWMQVLHRAQTGA